MIRLGTGRGEWKALLEGSPPLPAWAWGLGDQSKGGFLAENHLECVCLGGWWGASRPRFENRIPEGFSVWVTVSGSWCCG